MAKHTKKELRLQEANEKRLLAMKEHRNRSINQQKLITESLKSLDAPRNKVVRFESSDEETESKEIPTSDAPIISIKKSSHQLFPDDDDDVDHDREFSRTEKEIKFTVSQKYSGSAGQKLLAQQSKISGDSRFKMDSKFLADYEHNEEKAAHKSSNVEETESGDNFDQERGQQLNILERVLGKTIKPQKRAKNEEQFALDENFETLKSQKKIKNPFMVRFDPDNPTHYKYKRSLHKNEEDFDNDLQIDKKNLRLADELLERLDLGDESKKLTKQEKIRITESAYEVDEEFLSRLKTKSLTTIAPDDKGFSLLASLGRKDIEIPSTSDNGAEMKDNEEILETKIPEWKTSLLNPKARRKSSSSSSSDEDDSDAKAINLNEGEDKSNAAVKNCAQMRKLFFIYDDGKLLSEGDKFHCTQKDEDIRKKWSQIRPFLVKAYKKKHKDLIRNMRKTKNKHPRLEQDEQHQKAESRTKRTWKGPQRRNRLQC